jgi:phospholipid/cholesterol/gamma-HCH transport system ATP-binding protein
MQPPPDNKNAAPDVLLHLNAVEKTLGGRRILDRLSWELRRGECAVILGPSGGGKSVFLHTLLGLMSPDAGAVERPGMDNADPFATMAVMFQEDALLDERTVEANLAVAREERADCFAAPFADGTGEAIDAVLREVELDPPRVRRKLPSQLSGGMRRRVALARALIRRPAVLVADEPTTGLDPASSARVYDLLGRLIQRRGMSAVIITHDPACASRLGYPVYYFSPIDGRMPCWKPTPAASHEDHHRALLLWMQEQVAAHIARAEARPADIEAPPPDAIASLAGVPGRFVESIGRLGVLLGELRRPPSLALLLRDLLQWGVGTLPLTFMIFLLLGMIMEIQAEAAVVEYGFSVKLPELVALSLLRLAPILTGFLMAGRCGSAIGAQIGWKGLGGQMRALQTMRLDPERALFPPIFWSLTFALPLLALAGLAIGSAGALLILNSPLSGAAITPSYFYSVFPDFLTPLELTLFIVKGLLMGAGLALITWSGAAAPKRSPDDVTRSITLGLVLSFVWMTLVDALLGLFFPI